MNCNICNDFIYGHSYGPTCPDCMKNKSKDAMTTCKCSEMKWHPYPEEPVTADYKKEYWIQLDTGEIRTGFKFPHSFVTSPQGGPEIKNVVAYMPYFTPPPYTPPPKKKTVRVSQKAIISAIEGYFFQFDKKGHLTISDLPDFIEIEVSDE